MQAASPERRAHLTSALDVDPDAHPWQHDVLQCIHVLERTCIGRGSRLRPHDSQNSASDSDGDSPSSDGESPTRHRGGAFREDRMQALQQALRDSCVVADARSPIAPVSPGKSRRLSPRALSSPRSSPRSSPLASRRCDSDGVPTATPLRASALSLPAAAAAAPQNEFMRTSRKLPKALASLPTHSRLTAAAAAPLATPPDIGDRCAG